MTNNNADPISKNIKKIEVPNIPVPEKKEGDLSQTKREKLEEAARRIQEAKTVTEKVTGVIEKDAVADKNDISETNNLKDKMSRGLDEAEEKLGEKSEIAVPTFPENGKSKWKTPPRVFVPEEEKPGFLKKDGEKPIDVKKVMLPPDPREMQEIKAFDEDLKKFSQELEFATIDKDEEKITQLNADIFAVRRRKNQFLKKNEGKISASLAKFNESKNPPPVPEKAISEKTTQKEEELIQKVVSDVVQPISAKKEEIPPIEEKPTEIPVAEIAELNIVDEASPKKAEGKPGSSEDGEFKTAEEVYAYLADSSITDEEKKILAKEKTASDKESKKLLKVREARMLQWRKLMSGFSDAELGDFAKETKGIRNKYSFPGVSGMKSNADWLKHSKDWDKKSDAEKKALTAKWPHMSQDEQMSLFIEGWNKMTAKEKAEAKRIAFEGWEEFSPEKKAEINKKRKEELREAFLKHGLVPKPKKEGKEPSPDDPWEWVNASEPRKFDPLKAEYQEIPQDMYKKDKLGKDWIKGAFNTGPVGRGTLEDIAPRKKEAPEAKDSEPVVMEDVGKKPVIEKKMSAQAEEAPEVLKSSSAGKKESINRRTPDEIKAEIADLEKLTGPSFFGDKSALLAKVPAAREERRDERKLPEEPVAVVEKLRAEPAIIEPTAESAEETKQKKEPAVLVAKTTIVEPLPTVVSPEIPRTGVETPAAEGERGKLTADQKLNGALVLGLIPFSSIPPNPVEREAFVKRLDLTRFSEEALAKAFQLFDAERAYNASFRGITEQAKLNGTSRDKVPGYGEMWNESRFRLLELNALLERDERKRWEALYPDDLRKVNEGMANMQEGSFRHWLVRGLNRSVLTRRNTVRQEALESAYPERKPGFFKKLTLKWRNQPRWKKAIVGSMVFGAGTAVLGGIPLTVVGSFLAYKALRGLTGAAASGMLQGLSEKTFLKWFKRGGEKKIAKAVEEEYMGGRTEYWNLVWGKHYEHLADKNIRMAELLGQKYEAMKTKLAKKEKRLRFGSMVLTGIAGGYGGGMVLDSLLSGGESMVAELVPPVRTSGVEFPTATPGDSVWTLLDKNLRLRMDGFSELPTAQQNYIIDYYKDIVVARPSAFGLTNPNLIQPGFGQQFSPLFEGPNRVPMDEVLQASQNAGRF